MLNILNGTEATRESSKKLFCRKILSLSLSGSYHWLYANKGSGLYTVKIRLFYTLEYKKRNPRNVLQILM